MRNEMDYECQAWFGNTIMRREVIKAADTKEAKEKARRWLAEVNFNPPATQVVLLLGGTPAWASPLPEAL